MSSSQGSASDGGSSDVQAPPYNPAAFSGSSLTLESAAGTRSTRARTGSKMAGWPGVPGGGAAGVGGAGARRKGSEWEILGSLEKGTAYSILPKKHEGFLSKRRKWPLKGWHKRYFTLQNGVLTYGKSPTDIARGRTHGRIDVGAAVISAKTEMLRIDIDDEECIHHIKVANIESFALWLEQLKQHRLYQQYLTNSATPATSPAEDMSSTVVASAMSQTHQVISPRNSLPRGLRPPGSTQAWAQEFAALDENMTRQLLKVQEQALSLALLAQRAEDEHNSALGGQTGIKSKKLFGLRKKKSVPKTNNDHPHYHQSHLPSSRSSTLTSEKQSPVFPGSGESDLDSGNSSSTTLVNMASLSTSNPSLTSGGNNAAQLGNSVHAAGPQGNSIAGAQMRPISLPGEVKLGKSHSASSQMATTPTSSPSPASSSSYLDPVLSSATRDEMLSLAEQIQLDVSNLMRSFAADRDRLKQSLESLEINNMGKTSTMGSGGNFALVASLRQSLNQAMQQNSMLRAKLQKIHMDSDVSDLPLISTANVDTLSRGMNHSLSYSSSCISEFFDAREYTTDHDAPSDDSSDDETGGSESESTSDDELFVEANLPSNSVSGPVQFLLGSEAATSTLPSEDSKLTQLTGRRQKLPIPKADTEGINLWNLLCKNIGKDLSKISMPVTLNEPLSALQRLCEELEYSELLDRAAAETESNLERMTWVAAFAVSVYGSCQARAGHKPFNPLLGETFECVREDRGFRYVAEQVSHHPPVSACHASSLGGKWTWWQDLRVKTKFWGKSMEFQPEGIVSVQLNLANDRTELYEWNKITTCIHNLFGGADRYVDLYGQCIIKSQSLTCKIDFAKASYFSNKRHEIYGTITDKNGKVLQHLFGKWSEALYIGQAPSAKCIWRPAILPADSDLYYGFSRFAVELNELLPSEKHLLPPTDTRFRPDQRMLEEGQIPEAETLKLQLEQNQRERSHAMEESGRTHLPKWFGRRAARAGGAAWAAAGKAGAGEAAGQVDDRWVFEEQYWIKRKDPGFKNCDGFVKLW